MLRKLTAVLLAMLLGIGAAHAESAVTPAPPVSGEEAHALMEGMFRAAAGVTADEEAKARKKLSEDEKQARSEAQAAYRRQTLAWLLGVFAAGPADAAPTETPVPTETPAPEASAEPTDPVPTWEDGYAALQGNPLGREYLEALARLGATDAQSSLETMQRIAQQWLAEIDHEALLEVNGDYACWIYGPGTPIDYPIVHDENNDYYLNHLFDGRRNSSGTLFMDYRNLPGFLDPNTLVYGHHMRNGTMFGTLTDYYNGGYYEAHPYMLLVSEGEICVIELFAGYVTSSGDHCYDIAISDEEDMLEFIATAMRKSDFESLASIQPTDRLITLSTCAYAFENARYIAIGRLLTAWEGETDCAGKAGESQ